MAKECFLISTNVDERYRTLSNDKKFDELFQERRLIVWQ